MWAFAQGGNAVDAAVAANAAIAVTGPHMCGLGGDLFALVSTPDGGVHALNASGRAGSGADAEAMRAEGLREMPLRHDIRIGDRAGLRRRLGRAARTVRATLARDGAEAGDPAGGRRVPGEPAARRLARAARRGRARRS